MLDRTQVQQAKQEYFRLAEKYELIKFAYQWSDEMVLPPPSLVQAELERDLAYGAWSDAVGVMVGWSGDR